MATSLPGGSGLSVGGTMPYEHYDATQKSMCILRTTNRCYIPPETKTLYIGESLIESIDDLPSTLVELHITNCPNLRSICPFPKTVHHLVLDCLNLTELTPLPPNLLELHISHMKHLSVIPPFPSTLKLLDLYNMPVLRDMSPIPASIQNLRHQQTPLA